MINESLVEKLEDNKFDIPVPSAILEDHRMAKLIFNHEMDHAIAIVRQYEVEQPQDVVKRMKKRFMKEGRYI